MDSFSLSRKLTKTFQSCHDPVDLSQPRIYTVGSGAKLAASPRSLLALSFSQFVPFSFPQLFHNIQRTGAHNPGCKHTGGPQMVQQQPWARDAYELACIWGTTSYLHKTIVYFTYCSSLCSLNAVFYHFPHQEYNPDQASAPPKKKKPDGAPPTPSTDHVAPPGDRSRLVQGVT